jgi:hypothetical protein
LLSDFFSPGRWEWIDDELPRESITVWIDKTDRDFYLNPHCTENYQPRNVTLAELWDIYIYRRNVRRRYCQLNGKRI